jgi:hypothetical protein
VLPLAWGNSEVNKRCRDKRLKVKYLRSIICDYCLAPKNANLHVSFIHANEYNCPNLTWSGFKTFAVGFRRKRKLG